MDIAEKKRRFEKLKRDIENCRRCSLYRTRTHAVCGEGDINADILFVGEAPGRNEDLQGKPFVGRAGEVFDQLLHSVGLTRQRIFLCNILKCRPPQNRNPLEQEIRACAGSLDIQIKVVEPKIIATIGTFATNAVFQKFDLVPRKISQIHGKVIEVATPFGRKKIIPLYHPAFAVYNQENITILLKDFQVFREIQ